MNEPTEEARANLESILKKHVMALGEHFETVQVFVSNYETGGEGNTVAYRDGTGNFHARMNQCRQWIVRNDEATRLHAQRDFTKDDNDE